MFWLGLSLWFFAASAIGVTWWYLAHQDEIENASWNAENVISRESSDG